MYVILFGCTCIFKWNNIKYLYNDYINECSLVHCCWTFSQYGPLHIDIRQGIASVQNSVSGPYFKIWVKKKNSASVSCSVQQCALRHPYCVYPIRFHQAMKKTNDLWGKPCMKWWLCEAVPALAVYCALQSPSTQPFIPAIVHWHTVEHTAQTAFSFIKSQPMKYFGFKLDKIEWSRCFSPMWIRFVI